MVATHTAEPSTHDTVGTPGSPSAAGGPRPSILLISGWNLYNMGDVAITPAFMRLVKRYLPEAKITVLAQTYPEELRAYLQKFPDQLGDFDLIPMEFKAGEAVSPEMDAAFAGADLLVLNSGMTLSFGYYGHDWNRYLPRLLAFMHARELGVPYGIYGHSFDKLDPPADILYRDVLGTASFVYTRDSESLKLLQSKGVACPEMAFAPDSTFAFDLRNAETHAYADRFLAEHRLERGKFLAFVPRLDVHRFRDDGREHVHAAQTRDLISQWVRRTGEPVVLVPEVWHKTKLFDIPADAPKTMVLDQLPDDVRPHVRLMPDYWMPDEAQAVYERARLVVSAEMHSVILGLAAGVPSVHPHFSQAGLKQWMLRDLGIEEWLFDQDVVPVERIADAIVAVRENPEQARRMVDRAAQAIRRRQDETMEVVREAALSHHARVGADTPRAARAAQ
jgi:polysaccharide pyruvyl transferase WcaK-like protein